MRVANRFRLPEDQPIPLRPHHVPCILGWQGKGYSVAFSQNMQRLVDLLIARPETRVYIASYGLSKDPSRPTDKICTACPHTRIGSLCKAEERIAVLDNAWANTLELKVGQIHAWKDLTGRLREQVTLADFRSNCASCEWQPLGYCDTALREHGCREI